MHSILAQQKTVREPLCKGDMFDRILPARCILHREPEHFNFFSGLLFVIYSQISTTQRKHLPLHTPRRGFSITGKCRHLRLEKTDSRGYKQRNPHCTSGRSPSLARTTRPLSPIWKNSDDPRARAKLSTGGSEAY